MALSEENKKTQQITFWLSNREKQDLQDLANSLGLDLSKTIREGLSQLRITPRGER